MRLLLDTQAIFWWLMDEAQLSTAALSALEGGSNDIHVSIVSAWEIAIKVGLGKWPEATVLIRDFEQEVSAEGFGNLVISVPHVRLGGLMKVDHRDPFDRLLAAQAILEGMTLVTSDRAMPSLGAPCLW